MDGEAETGASRHIPLPGSEAGGQPVFSDEQTAKSHQQALVNLMHANDQLRDLNRKMAAAGYNVAMEGQELTPHFAERAVEISGPIAALDKIPDLDMLLKDFKAHEGIVPEDKAVRTASNGFDVDAAVQQLGGFGQKALDAVTSSSPMGGPNNARGGMGGIIPT